MNYKYIKNRKSRVYFNPSGLTYTCVIIGVGIRGGDEVGADFTDYHSKICIFALTSTK